MPKKRESELKSAFMREVKRSLPAFVAIRHEDVRTSGTPDLSITGAGRTIWLEFKHATPRWTGTKRQELMMLRLATAGYARYVFWWETAAGLGQRTMIVHPRQVHGRTSWKVVPESYCEGFDHRWLVQQIREAHRV
jgi:hypothetical protein